MTEAWRRVLSFSNGDRLSNGYSWEAKGLSRIPFLHTAAIPSSAISVNVFASANMGQPNKKQNMPVDRKGILASALQVSKAGEVASTLRLSICRPGSLEGKCRPRLRHSRLFDFAWQSDTRRRQCLGRTRRQGVAGMHMRGNSPSVLAYVRHTVETFGTCLSIPDERSPPCTR